MRALRRIRADLLARRNLDAYVVAAAAVALAVLSLVDDVVDDRLREATTLAALGLLVYRITVPELAEPGDLLRDRAAFDGATFGTRVRDAHELWILAPSASTLLTPATADDLRRSVLARPDGVVRVVLLDPASGPAVQLASRQLDDSTDYPVQELTQALHESVKRLGAMSRWPVNGHLEHRFMPYNAGLSLVAIDPHTRHGVLIVEFHGVHNESTAGRMHVMLRRARDERWFSYWVHQFEHVWEHARVPHD